VLLDDRGYVTLLKLYVARARYTHALLFRVSINRTGGPPSTRAHRRRRVHRSRSPPSRPRLRRDHPGSLLEGKIADAEVRAAPPST
jgi:integrase/recombinase XerD